MIQIDAARILNDYRRFGGLKAVSAWLLLFGSCLPATPALTASLDKADSVAYVYDLIMDDRDIGDIRLVKSSHGTADRSRYRIEESCSIKTSGTLGSWEMALNGEIVIDQQGILRIDQKITENQENIRVSCDRQNRSLWCHARKVLTGQQRKNRDLVDLSSMIASETIPYASEAATIVGLLENKQNSEGDIRIPLDSFDTTSEQIASFLLRKPSGLKNEKVRVFDTTELTVATFKITELQPQTLTIKGKSFQCRVFDATTPEGTSRYWLKEDAWGGFQVKEIGKDRDGRYAIMLRNR